MIAVVMVVTTFAPTLPVPPTPPPVPSAAPHATAAPPSATPFVVFGSPRRFAPPNVHPQSPHFIDVSIDGPPIEPTPRPTTMPGSGVWPVRLPSLRERDGSSALDVVVFASDGSVVARGIPTVVPTGGIGWSETESFALQGALVPRADAYTVVARYRDDPTYVGSSRYLIADVSPPPPRVGSAYVSMGEAGPISTIFYVRSVETVDGRTRLTLRTRGSRPLQTTVDASQGRSAIGSMVVSADLADVRRRYLDTNVAVVDESLVCYNARHEAARMAVLPGKTVYVDQIVRAAHTIALVADDPHAPLPFGGTGPGTYVDSPIVVGFRLAPTDVRIIPPAAITHVFAFHGNCTRGYVVLRDPAQLNDVLTLAP